MTCREKIRWITAFLALSGFSLGCASTDSSPPKTSTDDSESYHRSTDTRGDTSADADSDTQIDGDTTADDMEDTSLDASRDTGTAANTEEATDTPLGPDETTDTSGARKTDSGDDTMTPEEMYAICEAAKTKEECAQAVLPPLDCEADCWHGCEYTEFIETTVDTSGRCVLGERINACRYIAGGEEGYECNLYDEAGCGVNRGLPAYYEHDGRRATAFLCKSGGRGNAVQLCHYDPAGLADAPECACLCEGTSDPALECDSSWYSCTDPASGLAWEVNWDDFRIGPSPPSSTRSCEEVSPRDWGWALPNIEQLRTLVRGCPDSETGGACRVGTNCTDASCKDAACAGCAPKPYPERDCYMPREIGWTCGIYWSTTTSPEGGVFGVDFVTGEVILADPVSDADLLGRYVCTAERDL